LEFEPLRLGRFADQRDANEAAQASITLEAIADFQTARRATGMLCEATGLSETTTTLGCAERIRSSV
jgi:hypothetical protein